MWQPPARLPYVMSACASGGAAHEIWIAPAWRTPFYELDNLNSIWDLNRLGQRGEMMHGYDLDSYADRVRAFGCAERSLARVIPSRAPTGRNRSA